MLLFHSVKYALCYSFNCVIDVLNFLVLLVLKRLLLPAYVHVELILLVTLGFKEVGCFDYIIIEIWLFIFQVQALDLVFALFNVILVHL